ncbi:hypothetical protein [Treponema sp.]|uniref:hypothetical protein n=1 Tax=Treponema sp. TaxID=166 RepID=UPI00388FA5D7
MVFIMRLRAGHKLKTLIFLRQKPVHKHDDTLRAAVNLQPQPAAFEIPDTTGNFEWTAELINISQNHNISLQKKCEPLYNYIQYISRISENKKKGMSAVNAVDEAMDWAVHANLLNGFFKVQKEEVLAMSLTEYDEEEVRRDFIEEGREMGIAEGITQGAQQKAIEDATNLLKLNALTPEQISSAIRLPLEQVLELKKQLAITV